METERRQAPRMNVEGSAYINLHSDGGTIVNISETGLCFHSTAPVHQNATIHLLFAQDHPPAEPDGRLPWTGSLGFIEVDSELAWMDETRKRGGLRFINLTAEARLEIRNWISQHTLPRRR
jgi:hypothetical protein